MKRAALTLLSALTCLASQASLASQTSTTTVTAPEPEMEASEPATSHVTSTELSSGAIEAFSPGSNNLAFEMGPFTNSSGGQLHYTYGISDIFGFDASAGYSSNSDNQFSMGTLLAGLRTNLAYYGHLIPYALCGAGLYKPSYSFENALNTGQDTISPVLLGIYVGLGTDFQLTHDIYFGGSITVHEIFGGDEQIPGGAISTGGTVAAFLLHAGYSF
jgi:hypothetical protein